jgi:uncharacterized membrane protein SpoIIM required for sporulation
MISNRWIELRKEHWSRLEMLVQQVETGALKSLAAKELREFGLLYRQAAADLSAVRADEASRTLEAYLNRLVSRAHNHVYSGGQMSAASVWDFLVHGYPRLFRKLLPYTVAATAVCLAGALLGTLVTMTRPAFMHRMLGPQMVDMIEHHRMWTDSILRIQPEASVGIMANNITVCFFTFVGGVAAGVGTIWLMFSNGLQLGVVATACAQHGMALSLWSFVAAHGALELPSIFISGGAGLRLATGLLFPGMLRRKDALAVAGGEAARLISGTVPLLVIAGTLEAFLSPTKAPVELKFSVCALLLSGLVFWLSEGGRGGDTEASVQAPPAVNATA